MEPRKRIAALWRYIIKRNPPWMMNALPQWKPQTWAAMKRDCGFE